MANTELVHVLKNTFLSWKKSIEAWTWIEALRESGVGLYHIATAPSPYHWIPLNHPNGILFDEKLFTPSLVVILAHNKPLKRKITQFLVKCTKHYINLICATEYLPWVIFLKGNDKKRMGIWAATIVEPQTVSAQFLPFFLEKKRKNVTLSKNPF